MSEVSPRIHTSLQGGQAVRRWEFPPERQSRSSSLWTLHSLISLLFRKHRVGSRSSQVTVKTTRECLINASVIVTLQTPSPSLFWSLPGGVQLKIAIKAWTDWLPQLLSGELLSRAESAGSPPSSPASTCPPLPEPFPYLRAAADLLMLPKEMLMDRAVRKEVGLSETAPVCQTRLLPAAIPRRCLIMTWGKACSSWCNSLDASGGAIEKAFGSLSRHTKVCPKGSLRTGRSERTSASDPVACGARSPLQHERIKAESFCKPFQHERGSGMHFIAFGRIFKQQLSINGLLSLRPTSAQERQRVHMQQHSMLLRSVTLALAKGFLVSLTKDHSCNRFAVG
jgi:hypothetical protein